MYRERLENSESSYLFKEVALEFQCLGFAILEIAPEHKHALLSTCSTAHYCHSKCDLKKGKYMTMGENSGYLRAQACIKL